MPEILMYVGLIIIGAIFLAIFAFVIYRRDHPKKIKSLSKENKKERALAVAKKFAKENEFKYIENVAITSKDKKASLDAVVIGYFGVLGIKAMGYNGEIYGSAAEKEWVQVTSDGARTSFANPITEGSADVRVLREVLFNGKMRQMPVEVVCVFTDPKAQLCFPKSTGHYDVKMFKSLLRKDKFTKDAGYDLQKAEDVIKKAMSYPESR